MLFVGNVCSEINFIAYTITSSVFIQKLAILLSLPELKKVSVLLGEKTAGTQCPLVLSSKPKQQQSLWILGDT